MGTIEPTITARLGLGRAEVASSGLTDDRTTTVVETGGPRVGKSSTGTAGNSSPKRSI